MHFTITVVVVIAAAKGSAHAATAAAAAAAGLLTGLLPYCCLATDTATANTADTDLEKASTSRVVQPYNTASTHGNAQTTAIS